MTALLTCRGAIVTFSKHRGPALTQNRLWIYMYTCMYTHTCTCNCQISKERVSILKIFLPFYTAIFVGGFAFLSHFPEILLHQTKLLHQTITILCDYCNPQLSPPLQIPDGFRCFVTDQDELNHNLQLLTHNPRAKQMKLCNLNQI